MASDPVTLAEGTSRIGVTWEVISHKGDLLIGVDGSLVRIEGDEAGRFAEAVARATVPGQVT